MSDLDELKKLLFGAEKQALDSIAERVESREVRAADIAEVLPEAIRSSHGRDGELVDSLKEPVGECVLTGLHEDPETYSDALYPVMGPAIRKAITHALRSFSQQINQALEHSITPKGLKWRFEASRAGIPFGEYIVQKTLLYRVEQAYLISRANGLLMGHVHHAASKIKDSDAVSAMFTAIQDFVKESFSPDRTGRLESADMGEFTLWAVHGPHALLVCVIRGVPPHSLRSDLSAVLERIHFRYGDVIREYRGDTSSVPEVETELERCLRFEARLQDADEQGASGGARRRIILIVIVLALLACAVYFGARSLSGMQKREALEAALAESPGIYAAAVERDGKTFSVRGLRDPLAEDVAELAASVGVARENLRISMRPFHSLEPELLVRRSERVLGKPENVRFDVAGSTLVVSGEAPWSWSQQLRQRYATIAGIDSLDTSKLTSDDRARFEAAVKRLDAEYFHFEEGADLVPGAADAITDYAAGLKRLVREAGDFGYRLRITLIGSTDGSGSDAVNTSLSMARTKALAYLLSLQGIDVDEMRRASDSGDTSRVDKTLRYVQVRLSLDAAGAGP